MACIDPIVFVKNEICFICFLFITKVERENGNLKLKRNLLGFENVILQLVD